MARADDDIFADDFLETPYWWRAAPPRELPAVDLPRQADVAIIGSGFTGLNAAIEIARAGRSVVVIDKDDAGAGASSRNAGFVGRTLKHSFGKLIKSRGLDFAKRVYGEMQMAFNSVGERVEKEQIAAHFRMSGRLILLRNEAERRALETELGLRAEHLGHRHEMLSADRIHGEIGTRGYVAAALIEDLGSIHPGLYVQGLVRVALAAGVTIVPRTEVKSIAEEEGEVRVETIAGTIRAGQALVATNGYTTFATPYEARRTIPFDAYMIATETLPQATLDRLLPKSRTYLEDVHNIDFLRQAPDQPRILMGGRTGTQNVDLRTMARNLRGDLARILPDLANVKLSNVWTGRCAGTFDLFPHVGRHGRIHYASGYCFAGLPMGTYLGQKAAKAILGQETDAQTVFRELPFRSVPLIGGQNWFVPWVIGYWDWKEGKSQDHKRA
ncbi:MAG: FAD-binding oxidoreductase [Hyphomicrobiaceae bacterium]